MFFIQKIGDIEKDENGKPILDNFGREKAIPGTGPCAGQGYMSYTENLLQWSECSKKDFEAHYNTISAQWELGWKFRFWVFDIF